MSVTTNSVTVRSTDYPNKMIILGGFTINFSRGEYRTSNADIIALLEENNGKGFKIVSDLTAKSAPLIPPKDTTTDKGSGDDIPTVSPDVDPPLPVTEGETDKAGGNTEDSLDSMTKAELLKVAVALGFDKKKASRTNADTLRKFTREVESQGTSTSE